MGNIKLKKALEKINIKADWVGLREVKEKIVGTQLYLFNIL